MTTDTTYGKCQDCNVDLADRDAVTTHTRDTVAPTGEQDVVARGHRVLIVNPTEEERRASQARMHLRDAIDSAYEDLSECVERGDLTAAEIAAEMWAFDLEDGWDAYMAET